MATRTGLLIILARVSEAVLRRTSALFSGRRAVPLLTARVIGPGLTAIERFLDARAEVFSSKSWV
jgi:hypothetical protein